MPPPTVHPVGESALLISFGAHISEEINARARTFARLLQDRACPAVIDIVPAFASVLVIFDPLTLPRQELRELVSTLESSGEAGAAPPDRTHTIPVHYGGDDGPDLG